MRLISRVVASCVGPVLVLGLVTLSGDAQEPKGKSKASPPVKADEPKKVASPPGVRVPNHFNQVEPPLTPEQRERIYEVQAKALRDSESVLTPAQRTSLRRLREQAADPGPDEPAATKPATKGTPAKKDVPKKKAG